VHEGKRSIVTIVEGEDNIKMNLKINGIEECRLGLFCTQQDPLVGCFELGDEPVILTTGREFLDSRIIVSYVMN
jgi:hypothetical protein